MDRNLTDKQTLLDRLFGLQKQRGYSNEQMADLIGFSRQTYGKVLAGESPAGDAFLWRALQFMVADAAQEGGADGRKAVIKRQTAETNIAVELGIDGRGRYQINTGVPMLNHLLSSFARHGLFDINITANGDNVHHIVEDVAICLGKVFGEALGEKRGIVRMAEMAVPMDEALASVAVDIGGRGYAVLELPLGDSDLDGLPADLLRHFLETFALEARLNLHATIARGSNNHHKAEALFKALGRALDAATRVDPRVAGELPTTKDYLEG